MNVYKDWAENLLAHLKRRAVVARHAPTLEEIDMWQAELCALETAEHTGSWNPEAG